MSEELSINNIFIKNNKQHSNTHRLLTNSDFNVFEVKSAYEQPEMDDLVVKKIKLVNRETKEKIEEVYNSKYLECISAINNSIDIGLLQTIYFVPFTTCGLKKYNHKDCIKYIVDKLLKKGFDAIENLNTIYVSWKNIK